MPFNPPKKLTLTVEVEMTEEQTERWYRANNIADIPALVDSIAKSIDNPPHFTATVREVLKVQEDRGAGWFDVDQKEA